MKQLALLTLLVSAFFTSPQKAHAWEWLRSENRHVADGNERMRANDAAGALRLYTEAARELPHEGGVHLNRGLALLATDQLDQAREAFLLATDPPASAEIRAAAYYDLGIAFYRQADAKAGENDHQEAQRLFREAADSFRRSLRAKPGNRDAAWNLELALRRIQEQQQQQQQQEQQQQQQQQEQQQDQQDQQQQDQQNQDQQEQQQQDQQDQQQQENGQNQDSQEQQQQGQNQDQEQQQQGQQDQNQQEQGQPRETEGNQQEGQNPGGEEPATAQEGEEVPADVARVLDSLQNGEENLERMRARVRAMRENRRPAQDW